MKRRNLKILFALFVALMSACAQVAQQANSNTGQQNQPATNAQTNAQMPMIEASPVTPGKDHWQIANANPVTLRVKAPGADAVKILYRPLDYDGENEQYVELQTLNQPSDKTSGEFQTQLQLPEDFAGDVWAQLSYPDGSTKETQPVALAVGAGNNQNAQSANAANVSPNNANAANRANNANGANNGNNQINPNESARSDKVTGGHIQHAALQPGQPDVRITVNVPAFLLTLWQNGKEIKTYPIGVGRKDYPLPIGERQANEIILNPTWIPPNSKWVHGKVKPGEHIEASSPLNPLGKIKIPLGDAYLIHQAEKPSDIGHLVSHGCIRMLENDLFDLVEKIVQARNIPRAIEEIKAAKNSDERQIIKLDSPLPVDINYDTSVVEGGVLHLYPDVYDRNNNPVQELRDELQSAGVDVSKIDDATLQQMLDRVSRSDQFMVKISDIKAGHPLDRGRTVPLTEEQAKEEKNKQRNTSAQNARRHNSR